MHSEPFLPPTPRALSDAELQEVLDRAKAEGGGVLAAMQILEAQAQLRETDKSERRAWEAMQVTNGSEEEVATIEDENLAANTPEPTPAVQVSVSDVLVQTKRSAKDPSSSQFWVWLTISGSLLPVGISLWLSSLGLTFGQALTAALLGIFASAGVVAVGAIAGKRSSLPTLVLSRAAFGVFGNLPPALVLVISRVFWAFILVSLGYLLIAQNLTLQTGVMGDSAPISWPAVASLVVMVTISVILASYGGPKLVWAQRVSGIVGLLSVVAIVLSNLSSVGVASEVPQSGSWLRALGAAVVIFAMFGLAWSSASADYASGLPVNVLGWKVAGWALLSMAVVPATLSLLALSVFSNRTERNFSETFGEIVSDAGSSSVIMLVQLSLALTLITTIAMSLRSTSRSFESVRLRIKASIATPIIAVFAVTAAVVQMSRLGASGFWFNLNGYALFLAVPVAAWTGIFVSDVLIRRIAYHEVSLSRGYGFYKSVNVTNLVGWCVAVAIGWGLLESQLVEMSWLGYLADLSGNSEFWAQSNFGVVIAFSLGLLLPVIAGIPRIKKQEAEVLVIESRRNDLKDVLGVID